jgi:hypothetical protein
MSPFALALAGPALAASFEIGPDDDLSVVESLSPGDELVLKDGTYTLSGTLTLAVAGTESEPVIVRARNKGAAVLRAGPGDDGSYPGTLVRIQDASFLTLRGVVIEGDDTWTTDSGGYVGLRVERSTDITLDKLDVGQVGRAGIVLSEDNARVTINRTHVHDTFDGSGISVGCWDGSCWTSELTLFNNWVHDIGGEDGIGLRLLPGTQGAQVTHNVVYATGSVGVFLAAVENGDGNYFEGNAVWSAAGAGLLIEGAAQVRNNIIFNVEGRGIWTRDPERDTDTFGDLVISHNTIVDTSYWGVELDDWETAAGTLVFANNAVCNPIGRGVEIELSGSDTALPQAPGYVSSNVVCGQVTGMDRFDNEVVPGAGFEDFTDADGWNFYPVDGAVIQDAGDRAGDAYVPQVDFNGVARPGNGPDAGAYERDGDANPGWPVREGFKEFDLTYQNPQEFVGGCCDDKNNESSKGAQAALLLPLLGFGAALRRRRRRRG